MNLSFRCTNVTLRQGIIIIICFSVGIMLPIIYAVWWIHGDGAKLIIKSMKNNNPVTDAQISINENDFRLYSCGEYIEQTVPGIGLFSETYKKNFGYRFVTLYDNWKLTDEQKQTNQHALEYMKTYNIYIFQYVNQTFPGWPLNK